MKLPYFLRSCLFLVLLNPLNAQDSDIIWNERRAAEKGKSPYVSRIIEYRPAPGQFINEKGIGTPEAAESVVGGVKGLVSLGGFGGYIVVGFDHTIWDDPDNPYGVDFTVVGNAAANTSEPGIVMVMADTNGNGLPDDTWYELKGSNHDLPSTVKKYTITYMNPETEKASDIPWIDNQGGKGSLLAVSSHTQSYYPGKAFFPDYPQEKISFTGTLIASDINSDDPQWIRIQSLPYGYADNYPFKHNPKPFLPDDPATTGVLEGNGGNAFDISWAVDEEGNHVILEGIDFIKVYTAVNANAGWLGEISTEICGIIDVSPGDITYVPSDVAGGINIYPNPASEMITISSSAHIIDRIEISDMTGKIVYVNPCVKSSSWSDTVRNYTKGLYLVKIYTGKMNVTRKIIID